MKVSNQLAALLSLGALLPVAASAKTSEQAYLESCRKGPDIPVPVVVVAPHVGSEEAGASAQVEFLVGADGKASEISVKSSSDSLLASAAVDAIKQWQFTPAQRDGVAVATKVVLPIHVVEVAPEGFASN